MNKKEKFYIKPELGTHGSIKDITKGTGNFEDGGEEPGSTDE